MKLSPLSKALMLGMAVALIGAATTALPWAQELEETAGLDWLFTWRGSRPAPPDVVIVAIDKSSADRLGLPNDPAHWPRSLHARLIEQLSMAGATVIGFDIIFKEPRAREHDHAFAAAIERAGNVVLFQSLHKETISTGTAEIAVERLDDPLPAFARGAAALAPFPLPKVPVKISQVWAFKSAAGDVPTFPVVMMQLHALPAYDELRQQLSVLRPAEILPDAQEVARTRSAVALIHRLRQLFKADPSLASAVRMLNERATDGAEQQLLQALLGLYRSSDSLYLNYYGPPRSVTTIPYYEVLRRDQTQSLNLRGKAVFVGFAESRQPEQKDGFYTVYSLASGLDISGVEIAATAFANLLDGSAVKPLNLAMQLAVVSLWGLTIGFIFRLASMAIAIPAGIGAGAIYLVIAQTQFNASALWLPIVVPLLWQAPLGLFAAVFWRVLDTQRERDHIRRAFGYYLPARVVNELAKSIGDVRAGGEVTYGVCLSTDAEQYTTLAEQMAPRDLGALLNDYYATVFRPVKSHGGIVSDVIGDAMLAIWTGARPGGALRRQACSAALEIERDVEAFSAVRRKILATRIGLHTGEVLLGNVGAMDRYEYRAVGDIVNTATRIQELNKHLGTRVLASRESLEEVDAIVTRKLGMFLLAGKSAPLCIHELRPPQEQGDEITRRLFSGFSGALDQFKARRWREAEHEFALLRRDFAKDGPTRFYLELCRRYLANPPAADWSGVISVDKQGNVGH